MITAFEKDVREAFLQAKTGNLAEPIAKVDVHFVLPYDVYQRFEALIEQVTNGSFNVSAGYNLVLLYTNPQVAARAGTVYAGRDLKGLSAAWSRMLEEIATKQDPQEQSKAFSGTHSYFRSALWLSENPGDPCASANPWQAPPTPAKKPFWKPFSS